MSDGNRLSYGMAIPADTEESSFMPSEHDISLSAGKEIATQMDVTDESMISIPTKGQGKQILIYPDSKQAENTTVPCHPSSSEKPEKVIETQTGTPPDIRSTRKRPLAPTLQRYFEKDDSLPLTKESPDNGDEEVRKILKPPKKRKRPDSPWKKPRKDGDNKHQPVLNEEVMLMVLKQLIKDGININGQKFRVKLEPVLEEPPADKSYLDQHNFSPGNDVGENEGKSSDNPLPAISEEQTEEQSLPVFVQDNPAEAPNIPMDLSDAPMDLTYKPLDYSFQTNSDKIVAAESELDDCVEGIPPSTQSSNSLSASLAWQDPQHELDTANEGCTVDSSRPDPEVIADMEDEDRPPPSGETGQDNLPSLTHKTENLNLESTDVAEVADKPDPDIPNIEECMSIPDLQDLLTPKPASVPKPKPASLPKLQPASPAQLGVTRSEKKKPGVLVLRPRAKGQGYVLSTTKFTAKKVVDGPDSTVPNLPHLGVTSSDMTLHKTPLDDAKEALRNKIRNK